MSTLRTLVVKIIGDTGGFSRSLQQAERETQSFSGQVTGHFGGIGAGAVAMGNLIAAGVQAGAQALVSLGREALNAYADYERLGMSVQSLLAREIQQNSGTEKMVATGRAMVQLTDAQRTKLAGLKTDYEELGLKITIANEKLAKSIAGGKLSAAEIDLRKLKISEMKGQYEALAGKIANLSASDGKMVTTMQKVVEGQLSMNEALAAAEPETKKVLKWIERLAIISPFKNEDVAQVMQLSMAFGASSKDAQRLTTDLVDYAAATGKTGETLNRMALSLGQVRANGKLTGMEVRELAMAGLPVKQILAKAFNTTTANLEKMISAGLVPADQAIQAISESIEKDFAGAAERQAGTFSGLLSSLEDIKTVGLREFFTGTFQAIQPWLQKFVDLMGSEEFKAGLQRVGAGVGKFVGDVLTGLQTVVGFIQSNWPQVQAVVQPVIDGIFMGLQNIFAWVQTNWPAIQAAIVTAWANIWATVGPAVTAIGTFIQTVFGAVQTFLQTHGEEIKTFLGTAWATIRSIVEPVITWFYNTITTVFGGIATWINENQGEVQRIIQGVWDGIKMFIGTVLELIRGVVTGVLALLQGDVSGALGAIGQMFTNIWNGIRDYVGRAVETMRMILLIAWAKIRLGVTTAWNGVRTWIETAIENIIIFLRSVPERLVAIGRDIIEGLLNGLREAGNKIGEFLSGLVNGALNQIKKDLGIASPSAVMAEIGQQMMTGLAAGIGQRADLPQLALDRISADMTASMSGGSAAGNAYTFGSGAIVVHAAPGQDAAAIARAVLDEAGRRADVRTRNR